MIASSSADRARSRARQLLVGAGEEPAPPRLRARVVRHVRSLELRGLDDAERVDHLVVPASFAATAGVVVVASVLGATGVVAAAIAVIALDVVAQRTAPARRAAATDRELPVVLESVARRLRAGGSLAQALADAAPERPADLERSWRTLVHRSQVAGVEAALAEWSAGAVASASVRLAGAALALSAATGGSPARAIDGVADTLRSRVALSEEVRALSSQARTSAVVIATSPLVFGGAAASTDARTGAFLRTPLGLALLTAGVSLDAVGWWWMSRLCRDRAAP
jgi:tight adherence protein B